jgi:KAP family P-loop domain
LGAKGVKFLRDDALPLQALGPKKLQSIAGGREGPTNIEVSLEPTPPNAHTLWSDAEITSSGDDRLARARFCAQVADLINGIPVGAGSTVFGLVGPWGGGKSSILNLIQSELEQRNSANDGYSMAIAEFSPWASSDGASLMLEFFETLLGAHASLRSASNRESMAALVKKGLPMLSSIPVFGSAVSKTMEGVLGERNWIHEFSRIDELIAKAEVRVLIIVDDVDRLHGDEVLTLIKTIRLLGRFRNVHYLLAYDHDALIDSIRPTLGGDRDRASAYLEKIVQYPLTIPPAQQAHLRLMVENGLSRILRYDSTAWSRFSVIYDELLQERLQTVRAVKRFCAQADLYYSLLLGEVDITDFLVVSYLRLFFPNVYSRISLWKEKLTSEDPSDSTILTWENNLLTAGVVGSDDRIHVIKVLRTIFPHEFGVPALVVDTGVERQDYFDRYFVFGIPEGDVSDQQVRADVALAIQRGGHYYERDFEKTFTSPMAKVRSTALSKAASLVRVNSKDVASVTLFALWLVARQAIVDFRDSEVDEWLTKVHANDDRRGWTPFSNPFTVPKVTSGLNHFSRAVIRHKRRQHGDPGSLNVSKATVEQIDASWDQMLEGVAAESLERLILLSEGGPSNHPDEYSDLVSFLQNGPFVDVFRRYFYAWTQKKGRERDVLRLAACFTQYFDWWEEESIAARPGALNLNIRNLLSIVNEDVLKHIPLEVEKFEVPGTLWETKLSTAARIIADWRGSGRQSEGS